MIRELLDVWNLAYCAWEGSKHLVGNEKICESTFFLVDTVPRKLLGGVCFGTNQELTLLWYWDKICLGIDISYSFAWGA